MATVFALSGWDSPGDTTAQYFNGALLGSGDTLVPLALAVPNLTSKWDLPGAIPSADVTTLGTAVNQLDAYLTAQAGVKKVVAAGFGAIIASLWLKNKGPTSAISPTNLSFVLASNPVRKLGGALRSLATDIPNTTPYTVNDVALQYDGWADWPQLLAQTSAELGVINAMFSMTNGVNQYMLANLADPNKLVATTGNLTHTLLPAYPVPILLQNPIPGTGFLDLNNPILGAADKVLRPIIEAIYSRTIGSLPYPSYPPPAIAPPIDLPPAQPPGTPTQSTAPCLDPNHFYVKDGGIRPQPWMQERLVASGAVDDKSKTYEASAAATSVSGLNLSSLFGSFSTTLGNGFNFGGLTSGIGGNFIKPLPSLLGLGGNLGGLLGGVSATPSTQPAAANKNDLLQTLTVRWTNITPIDQWVYGLITRGGCRVTLQARSRGYIVVSSGYNEGLTPGNLEIASVMGCGMDIGLGGVLAIGTSFGIIEERMNAVTIPLAPERCGWYRLAPGKTFTGSVQVRFVTEFWEDGQIDGGSGETESSFDTGDLRLDLFACPALDWAP